MDTIQLIISENNSKANQEDIQDVDTISVTVLLNGQSMNDLVDISSLLGVCETEGGQFNLYTCSCGVPECAGFFDLIKHEKNINTITWILPDDDEEDKKYTFGKKVFVFDKKLFQKEINKFINAVLNYEKNEVYLEQHVNEVCPEYIYEIRPEENTKTCKLEYLKKHNFLSIINKSKKHYKSQEKFKNTIKNNFGDYLDKKIIFEYDGKSSEIEYDLGSLICRLMNEFPSYKVKSDYYFQVLKSGVELVKFINQEDNNLEKILKDSYQVHGLTTSSFLPYDFFKHEHENDDIDIDNFDLNLNLLKFNIKDK